MSRFPGWILLVATLAAGPAARAAESVAVAAAANLVHALDALTEAFKRTTPGVIVTASTGASGSLFAQVRNGAPFDVFLSADTDYPRELAAQNLADAGTLRTFATGRLVLWTTKPGLDPTDIAAMVRNPAVKKLALAQPRTAPYGRATQAALAKLGVLAAGEPKFVFGENITQTAQFVETGNADAGFVALSLVLSSRLANQGRWIEVPAALYADQPLHHAAVLTVRGARNPAARRYLDFLGSEPAKEIFRQLGYGVP